MAHWSKTEKRAAARIFARALPIQPPPRAPPQLNLIYTNGGTTTITNCWSNNNNNMKNHSGNDDSSSSTNLSSLMTNNWNVSKYNDNNKNTDEREVSGITTSEPDPSDTEVRFFLLQRKTLRKKIKFLFSKNMLQFYF